MHLGKSHEEFLACVFAFHVNPKLIYFALDTTVADINPSSQPETGFWRPLNLCTCAISTPLFLKDEAMRTNSASSGAVSLKLGSSHSPFALRLESWSIPSFEARPVLLELRPMR